MSVSGKETLSDAELTVMKVLWRGGEALSAAEAARRLQPDTGWSPSTVSTLLCRMAEKGMAGYEKRGKAYYYYPLVTEKEYKTSATRSFLGKLYDGSVRSLLASLVESNDVTEADLDELRDRFELK